LDKGVSEETPPSGTPQPLNQSPPLTVAKVRRRHMVVYGLIIAGSLTLSK